MIIFIHANVRVMPAENLKDIPSICYTDNDHVVYRFNTI